MPQSERGHRRPPVAMLYCHDSFGLGHLRRTLAIAGELRRRRPDLIVLLATGSPLAHAFRLPEGVDYLKLPSVVKTGGERYASRTLPLAFDEISKLRADVLRTAAERVRPQLVVVDNVPGGLDGEVVPALRALRSGGGARLVLGLRDIVDDPARVRRAWTRNGSYELLDEVYDRILVYGQPDVFDAAAGYGFSRAAAEKTRYVGYLLRGPRIPPAGIRAELGVDGRPLVLVTAGGGEDGDRVLRVALQARERLAASPAVWLFVTGPFLARSTRDELAARARALAHTHVVDFVSDLPACMAAADVVVSMAGYNSVCELLSVARPAILVPRVEPRLEQLLRARALEQRGAVRVLHPEDATPERLASGVRRLLAAADPPRRVGDLDGLTRTGDELDALLASADGKEVAVA